MAAAVAHPGRCGRGLRKAFGATVRSTTSASAIEPATVHALLGENGAGKSTIVKLLSGLMRPIQGHFAIFGEAARSALAARRPSRSASRPRFRK